MITITRADGSKEDFYNFNDAFNFNGKFAFSEGCKLKIIKEKQKNKFALFYNSHSTKKIETEIEILNESIVYLTTFSDIPIHIKIEKGSKLYIGHYNSFLEETYNLIIDGMDDKWFWLFDFEQYSEEEWLIKDIIE